MSHQLTTEDQAAIETLITAGGHMAGLLSKLTGLVAAQAQYTRELKSLIGKKNERINFLVGNVQALKGINESYRKGD